VRLRLLALGTGIVAALTGCGADAAGAPPARPPVRVVQIPAASAGGVCVRWDYRLIERLIGIRFEAAASHRIGDTSTCVVQVQGADRPDLALSVVEGLSADADLFTTEIVPAGATKLRTLGRAGYRSVSKATGDHGPVVEVGWLSTDRQLIILRFTFPQGASKAEASTMAGRVTALARKLDASID
jgi:hypothetical protein